jgi:hypothetical protein
LLIGTVRILLDDSAGTEHGYIVRARLCTHGQREIAPLEESPGADAQLERPLRFSIPKDLAPHQYRIKVLVATSESLNFASRPIFVRPESGCAETDPAQP